MTPTTPKIYISLGDVGVIASVSLRTPDASRHSGLDPESPQPLDKGWGIPVKPGMTKLMFPGLLTRRFSCCKSLYGYFMQNC